MMSILRQWSRWIWLLFAVFVLCMWLVVLRNAHAYAQLGGDTQADRDRDPFTDTVLTSGPAAALLGVLGYLVRTQYAELKADQAAKHAEVKAEVAGLRKDLQDDTKADNDTARKVDNHEFRIAAIERKVP
jgi:hypothetical protein